MLSGGVTPWENNYSQYLQARALVAFFDRSFPRDSIWVFFGAGNVEGQPPVLGDVRREVNRSGLVVDSWIAGSLGHNRPARRDIVLRALREEILPAVAGGGTLYLFVGDHGSQGGNGESAIDLWGLEPDAKNEHGWRSLRNARLTVTDLRDTLAKGLGKGRVVFCMTQCHSGGFHFLAVPRAMRANPKWFTTLPAWVAAKGDHIELARAAGFSATDERSLAAGCMADPDPLRWAGYERFLPEQLLGIDLFTLAHKRSGLSSFAQAHQAATLIDRTDDKPYATSEQYLERWAALIERVARERDLAPKVKSALSAFQRIVDGGRVAGTNAALRERQAAFAVFTQELARQSRATKSLVLNGTRLELERAIGPAGASRANDGVARRTGPATKAPRIFTPRQPARRATTNAPSQTPKLWQEMLRPAWSAAVERGAASRIAGDAIAFEKHLLALEAKGGDFFSGAGRRRLQEEAYWQSGYTNPATLNPRKAEAIITWGVTRRAQITQWASNSSDPAVRDAAQALLRRVPRQRENTVAALRDQANVALPAVSRQVAAERALFYRRVLAAWEFLLLMDEQPALERLSELTELERTPLPAPGTIERNVTGSR